MYPEGGGFLVQFDFVDTKAAVESIKINTKA